MMEGSPVQDSLESCAVSLRKTLKIILCLVLVQPRKTGKRPSMTGKMLTGT